MVLQITIFDTKIQYFLPRKISLFVTQSPYLKTQISLFEFKKISHVCNLEYGDIPSKCEKSTSL